MWDNRRCLISVSAELYKIDIIYIYTQWIHIPLEKVIGHSFMYS